jgi:uncharacterized small protein (DUF1192 family)
MNETASAAFVAELRNQIAILSERCALLAAELAAARAAATARPEAGSEPAACG